MHKRYALIDRYAIFFYAGYGLVFVISTLLTAIYF